MILLAFYDTVEETVPDILEPVVIAEPGSRGGRAALRRISTDEILDLDAYGRMEDEAPLQVASELVQPLIRLSAQWRKALDFGDTRTFKVFVEEKQPQPKPQRKRRR